MLVGARVLALFISVDSAAKRVEKEKLELDENGILDDKFYAKNKDRLILITSVTAYRLAKESGIELAYGSLGENILIDNDVKDLTIGSQFRIGAVVLEITQNCTLCKGLSTLDPNLPDILKHDRGIFAKSVITGIIRKEDSVII